MSDIDFKSAEYFKKYSGGLYTRLLRKIISCKYVGYIKKFVKSGKLLDIGCGTGDLMATAKKAGFDVTGIEISPLFVEHAKSRGMNVLHSALEEAEFSSDYFDVIVVLSVFQYVGDNHKFLDEVKRIMKKDGIMLIHVPEPYYTEEQLRKILEDSGFKIIFRKANKLSFECKFVEFMVKKK